MSIYVTVCFLSKNTFADLWQVNWTKRKVNEVCDKLFVYIAFHCNLDCWKDVV